MVKIPKIFILIFFLFCSNSLSSENNIVFLDMDFILTNSLAGKNINEQIDKINENKITELNKIEELIREKDKEISDKQKLNHIFAIESDAGGFRPLGFSFTTNNNNFLKLLEIGTLCKFNL